MLKSTDLRNLAWLIGYLLFRKLVILAINKALIEIQIINLCFRMEQFNSNLTKLYFQSYSKNIHFLSVIHLLIYYYHLKHKFSIKRFHNFSFKKH